MQLSKSAAHQRKSRAKRLAEDADGFRKEKAAYAKSWRKRNTKNNRRYMADYMVAWLSDPINARCHRARTLLSSMRDYLSRNNGIVKMRFRNKQIYAALKSIGWSYDDSSMAVNHIVSIKFLLHICPTLDFAIIYDQINIELVNPSENNSVECRKVGPRIIATAKLLEQKHPKELCGLADYVASKQGETV